MCRSMVDIQYATAEIRRGKKIEDRRYKKPQGKNIMACPLLWAAINSSMLQNIPNASKSTKRGNYVDVKGHINAGDKMSAIHVIYSLYVVPIKEILTKFDVTGLMVIPYRLMTLLPL